MWDRLSDVCQCFSRWKCMWKAFWEVRPTWAKARCPDPVSEELGTCRAFREKNYQVCNTHFHIQPSQLPLTISSGHKTRPHFWYLLFSKEKWIDSPECNKDPNTVTFFSYLWYEKLNRESRACYIYITAFKQYQTENWKKVTNVLKYT